MSDQAIDTCVFCKLAKGQLRADILYEDEAVLAFKDIHPQAPVHVLVIPRQHITALWEVDESYMQVLGRLLLAANEIAYRTGVHETGYRIVINTGPEAGQTVDHVHVHVLGGRKLTWPPG
ncbi:MAG: histidine triad family protein [Chloroflexia bacterium]|jgi:histidine triad (HIT) family protein|nr:histidine triad family protein [Chloroflexia bacterium]